MERTHSLVDIDVQDTSSDAFASTPEHGLRRRLLGAGLLGVAGSLLPQLLGRAAAVPPLDSAPDTTPDPSTPDASTPDPIAPDASTATEGATATTAPPRRPTPDDLSLLQFAQTVELAAVELYVFALAGGELGEHRPIFTTLRSAHLSSAQVLAALIGRSAPGVAAADAVEAFRKGFGGPIDGLIAAALQLESTAVATHAELLGQLQGTDAAALIASILMAESRHGTVLADMAGITDLDALLTSDAVALEPTKG